MAKRKESPISAVAVRENVLEPLKLGLVSGYFNDHFCSIGPRVANEIHVGENGPSHMDYLCETYECRFEVKTSTVSFVKSTEKTLQNNIGREKDRYQSSVTQVECP